MVAKDDKSFRARAAALQALGKLKAPNALATLNAAVAANLRTIFCAMQLCARWDHWATTKRYRR